MTKKKIPEFLFKNGDIITDSELYGACSKCKKLLVFERCDGLDIKLSTVCCKILYVAYPKTWEILINCIE